jgi:hypothetical protein
VNEKNKKASGKEKAKIIAGILSALTLISGMWARASEKDISVHSITMGVAETCALNVNGNPGRLTINIPAAATESSQNTIYGDAYVRYSTISARNKYRTLAASLETPDSLPPGCSLKLQAIPSGKKNEGVGTGQIVLSTIPQAIITGIGSCATGVGATDGARLILTLCLDNAVKLRLDERKTATIILTFMDSL